jgi:hypothetical protein
MPQPYTKYRDTVNALITEMEATTPADPDDAVVFVYRLRLARLRAGRVRDIAAVIGVALDSRLRGNDGGGVEDAFPFELSELCCPTCGLIPDDCYTGCVHSFACDRLCEPSPGNLDFCEDQVCKVCAAYS